MLVFTSSRPTSHRISILVDVVDGQLKGRGREGLRHGVAGVASVCRGRNGRVLLQGSQGSCVGRIVCEWDISGAVQAAGCLDARDIMGHGIDGSDRTTLGDKRGKSIEVFNAMYIPKMNTFNNTNDSNCS